MLKYDYKRIKELGVTIHEHPVPHVKRHELDEALGDKRVVFSQFFGIQTCYIEGPYPCDVESTLERMASGKLTGTQLDWD